MMNHGSLFSGIGGFDLASEWMGWNNVFHCEWNEFGQRILKYYWPKSKSYADITKTDFTVHRGNIDILTGGFPCQPYSTAGKRKGKEDERHLWPEMLRAIREIQPTYVVGENVLGIVNWNGGMVFNEVQAELEAEGYEVQTYVLPAASVNAPHKRDRVWFIAYSNHNRKSRTSKKNESEGKKERLQERDEVQQPFQPNNFWEISTHSEGESCGRKHEQRQRKRESGRCNCSNDVTNPSNLQLQGSQFHRSAEEERTIQTESRQSFRSVRSNWKEFPTQAPICDGDDGLSSRLDAITFPKWRTESVKGGGNAIVPQVAFQLFKTIEKYNHITP